MAASKPAPKKAGKSNKPVAKKATAPQKQLGKKPTAKTQKPVAKAKPAVSSKKVLPPARKQPAKPTAKVQTKKAPIATPKSAAKSAIAKKKEIKPIAKVAPKSLKKLPATKPKTVVKVAVITKNKQIKPVVKVAPKPIKKAPIAAPKPVAKAIAHSQPELQTKQKITAVPQKPAVQLKQATPPIMPVKKKEEIKPSKIVVPKTTVKTMVKYEPDFTKSVLDTNGHSYEPTLPTMRYSDHDLAEFRDLINRKLEVAKKELTYLQGLITHKDEMGGDNDDARYMTMEDGSLSMEREQLSQMASRQITFVDHLEKALMRIESKTYGVCRVTGKLIDKARLRAVPHATLSVEAKMGKVK